MKIRDTEVKEDHLCLFSDPALKSIPNNLETTQKVLSYDSKCSILKQNK